MIGWIITLVAIVAIFFVNKFGDFKKKFWLIIGIIILLLIFLSFSNVVKANGVNLASPSGIFSAVQLYFSWLGHAFSNIHVLTGNAVRMDWVGNSTA